MGEEEDMAAATTSDVECPVCHDSLQQPKILPCTHLVCRKCVVSWLEEAGNQGGCPLCREQILPASNKGQGDLASQVDALPTDLATAVVVESEKALTGSHVCSCEDAEAVLYCFQCSVKLCTSCAKTHSKVPTTQEHVTEKLSDLTTEQLASHPPTPCVNHSSKQAELYCTSHEELICAMCAFSAHRQCPDLAVIGDVATVKREELKKHVQKLEEKEAAVVAKIIEIDTQVSDGKGKFKAMRDEVKVTFDGLQKSLEARRQKLNADIQEREDTFLAERKSCKLDLENQKAALSAHKTTAERLVSSAADSSLLGMMGKLKSRLTGLESQTLPDDAKTTTGNLVMTSDVAEKVKKAVADIGMLMDSAQDKGNTADRCLWCGRSFEGPGYAAAIKVGDRVRRGKDWMWGSQDGSPPGAGTVTAVDADLKTGGVWVQWDCGNHNNYRMGRQNCYDLRLVL
ncbi:E3 ubiquitin-protein ligase TRIM45-like isoform X2 [Babylonia areolata]|uniref:E3 ubiquitin-protein ligase TRIM45-like isoform X2 n=1 Tax=Babylonia areolata TaxID=304850 RepID=UPI003FD64BAB